MIRIEWTLRKQKVKTKKMIMDIDPNEWSILYKYLQLMSVYLHEQMNDLSDEGDSLILKRINELKFELLTINPDRTEQELLHMFQDYIYWEPNIVENKSIIDKDSMYESFHVYCV